eukprot:GHRR01020673.1.p3 GENE.GHRR01020673.1~~GHRR01020673.1.p3  ORF type:complete len:114 (+),score=42.65 GHRR01020673.1:1647-1988(+)
MVVCLAAELCSCNQDGADSSSNLNKKHPQRHPQRLSNALEWGTAAATVSMCCSNTKGIGSAIVCPLGLCFYNGPAAYSICVNHRASRQQHYIGLQLQVHQSVALAAGTVQWHP